jgi:protein-disulfide isomerase
MLKKSISAFFFAAVVLFMLSSSSQAKDTGVPTGTEEKLYSAEKVDLPPFNLPVPQNQSEKDYLGLSGTGEFKVGQIKAQVVIIEVFSFYCPACQAQTPFVNDTYRKIEERPDLKEKIKMIGIAATNTAFEAQSFKETHHLPFPVFPDEEGEIAVALGVKYTPTFVGVKVDGKGMQERFYWLPGAFKDSSRFLEQILKTSGLE